MSKEEEESDQSHTEDATPDNLGKNEEDPGKSIDIDLWNDDDETVAKHSFEPSRRRSD